MRTCCITGQQPAGRSKRDVGVALTRRRPLVICFFTANLAEILRKRLTGRPVRSRLGIDEQRMFANQQRAPPARVLQVPEGNQSTRPPERAGIRTKVSAFKPLVAWAVAVMIPVGS